MYLVPTDVPKCTGLDPDWINLKTETAFPVNAGTELTVSCEDEFGLQIGSETITCADDTTFTYSSDVAPDCLGEYSSECQVSNSCR